MLILILLVEQCEKIVSSTQIEDSSKIKFKYQLKRVRQSRNHMKLFLCCTATFHSFRNYGEYKRALKMGSEDGELKKKTENG